MGQVIVYTNLYELNAPADMQWSFERLLCLESGQLVCDITAYVMYSAEGVLTRCRQSACQSSV